MSEEQVNPVVEDITPNPTQVKPVEDLKNITITGSKGWDIFLGILWVYFGIPLIVSIMISPIIYILMSENTMINPLFLSFGYLFPFVLFIASIVIAKKKGKKYFVRGIWISLVFGLVVFGACTVLLLSSLSGIH